jgi:DNA gyrase subunit A
MIDFAKEIISINIEEELKHSYLDYAMSVIISRALPDVRDGLKPVHRRILFAMHELGNDWNKPYKKSARIVGDVIGKYHPHGDTAVYDTIVRMAQPFSLRYPLVDGQGNFGSVDGDAPAAMRYTEIRMSKFAHRLLADLDKETVEFTPNYDETELIPTILPTRTPNLLVNGSSGIAVGMATNIPPHNLNEVINACIALIENPSLDLQALMRYIPGPDFPTRGIINGCAGIQEAYQTGKGRIYLRARTSIEYDANTNKSTILIHELPYQVNKARLLEKIGELVKEKKLEGITTIRDESDKDGMRVVIELRRGEKAEVILNNLYASTQMETVFGINMVALDQGQPRVLTLKELLEAFIRHRREVVTKRSVYELRKARERAHILEGLGIALANIDSVITIIKASQNPGRAKEELLIVAWPTGEVADLFEHTAHSSQPMGLETQYGLSDDGYHLSPTQTQAILELRLHRLTNLEQEKIFSEYESMMKIITDLLTVLSSPLCLMEVVRSELNEIKNEFGDSRRTEIIDNKEALSIEDLITEEDVVVTLSHQGYAKTQSLDAYHAQHRGGRGKSATQVKEEDYISHLLSANSHDSILCFSTQGKVYRLKVYQIPQASRVSLGRPIVNLLPLGDGERISAVLSVKNFVKDKYIMMLTSYGVIKKVSLEHFSGPRVNGMIAVDMMPGDDLVAVHLTDGNQDVMLFSNTGKVIRFHESEVRSMGRKARGVRGMRLKEGQQVIALIVAKEEGSILTVTENGYGKRTHIKEYPRKMRGGQGVISIQVNERNGQVVGAIQIADNDEILLISEKGTLVRTRVSEISISGRKTQGVRLINLSSSEEKLVGVQPVIEMTN